MFSAAPVTPGNGVVVSCVLYVSRMRTVMETEACEIGKKRFLDLSFFRGLSQSVTQQGGWILIYCHFCSSCQLVNCVKKPSYSFRVLEKRMVIAVRIHDVTAQMENLVRLFFAFIRNVGIFWSALILRFPVPISGTRNSKFISRVIENGPRSFPQILLSYIFVLRYRRPLKVGLTYTLVVTYRISRLMYNMCEGGTWRFCIFFLALNNHEM